MQNCFSDSSVYESLSLKPHSLLLKEIAPKNVLDYHQLQCYYHSLVINKVHVKPPFNQS